MGWIEFGGFLIFVVLPIVLYFNRYGSKEKRIKTFANKLLREKGTRIILEPKSEENPVSRYTVTSADGKRQMTIFHEFRHFGAANDEVDKLMETWSIECRTKTEASESRHHLSLNPSVNWIIAIHRLASKSYMASEIASDFVARDVAHTKVEPDN